MISYSVDESGRILSLNYSRRVTRQEVDDLLDTCRNHLDNLRPGFLMFSDLTNLESMDAACAEGLGTIMELLSERGISVVLRIIPDPSKDIGLNLISLFHYRKPVRVHTLANVAEALKVLLDEAPSLQPSEVQPSGS
ncbi:MAG TPA: hypothetical protein VHY09_15865 [Candidatus Methylacidiphilales bacterium]|jgi:hypothetical protein|nr:hypothetical protein [Candidatus Methylacidiphilales bacterium]